MQPSIHNINIAIAPISNTTLSLTIWYDRQCRRLNPFFVFFLKKKSRNDSSKSWDVIIRDNPNPIESAPDETESPAGSTLGAHLPYNGRYLRNQYSGIQKRRMGLTDMQT